MFFGPGGDGNRSGEQRCRSAGVCLTLGSPGCRLPRAPDSLWISGEGSRPVHGAGALGFAQPLTSPCPLSGFWMKRGVQEGEATVHPENPTRVCHAGAVSERQIFAVETASKLKTQF